MSKYIQATVESMAKAVMMASMGGDINGWVCEKVFTERTGIQTKSQLAHFRRQNPELARQNGNKFIYNLPAYFELFK